MRAITQLQKQAPEGGEGGGADFAITEAPVEQAPAADSPINKRFAELTGTIKEQREALARQQETTANLLATIAQLQQVNHRPAPVEPQAPALPQIQLPEGVDPSIGHLFQQQQAAFAKILEQSQKQTQELVQQAVRPFAAQTQNLELQQVLTGQPAEVQKLAQELYATWQRNGNTGWVPKDAVVHARGLLADRMGAGRRQIEDQTVPGGSVAPATVPGGGQQIPTLPDHVVEKMTLSQMEAYYRKRLEAQGGVDQPLLVR